MKKTTKKPKTAKKTRAKSSAPRKKTAAAKKTMTAKKRTATAKKPAAAGNAPASAKKESSSGQGNISPQSAVLPPGAGKKKVLHVGCGDLMGGSGLHKIFQTPDWEEVRLDIDPKVKPDIVADIADMHMIADGSYDAVWSSHNIEHLFSYQVKKALAEFYRVIKMDGFAYMATPDIQTVMEQALEKGLEIPLYNSPSGPIAAIDMLYGFRPSLAAGHHYMAHKTAFTAVTLSNKLKEAGFLDVKAQRNGYHLYAIGYKRREKTEKNQKVQILNPDINKMMLERDKIEKEPVIWKGYPPKSES